MYTAYFVAELARVRAKGRHPNSGEFDSATIELQGTTNLRTIALATNPTLPRGGRGCSHAARPSAFSRFARWGCPWPSRGPEARSRTRGRLPSKARRAARGR